MHTILDQVILTDISDDIIKDIFSINKDRQLNPAMYLIGQEEISLRSKLWKAWNKKILGALREIEKYIASKKTASDAMYEKILSVILKANKEFEKDIEKPISDTVEAIWKFAKTSAKKRTQGEYASGLYNTNHFVPTRAGKKVVTMLTKQRPELQSTLSLKDKAAIKKLKKQIFFWIGDIYDRVYLDRVQAVVNEVLFNRGYSLQEARKKILDSLAREFSIIEEPFEREGIITPKGFRGTVAQYFEGLAAHVATQARVRSVMNTFQDLNVSIYEVTNPIDERTCDTCSFINGKRFEVTQAMQAIENEEAATTKEQAKNAHPWRTMKETLELTGLPRPTPGHISRENSSNLMSIGQGYPPFHFRCRCTVDYVE